MHCSYSERRRAIFYICKHFDTCALGDIVDCCFVRSDDHKLENVTLAQPFFPVSSLLRIKLNVIGEHFYSFKTNCPVKFCNLHSAFYVEVKHFTEDDVVIFGQQRAYELATLMIAVAVI